MIGCQKLEKLYEIRLNVGALSAPLLPQREKTVTFTKNTKERISSFAQEI